MRKLDEAIITAIKANPPADLAIWQGSTEAVFYGGNVSSLKPDSTSKGTYTVVGPTISDEDEEFKPGSHREVIVQLSSFLLRSWPAYLVDQVCEDYRTMFNRDPSALSVSGWSVVLIACSGYVWADANRYHGRVQEMRVLLEAD